MNHVARVVFLLGDPLYFSVKHFADLNFVFVLSEQSVLTASPWGNVIEMLHRNELAKAREDVKTIVWQLAFSLNGVTLYVVSTPAEPGGTHISAWDVLSGEFKAEKNSGNEVSFECCPLALREGVLLRTNKGSLELWNFELSECVRSWTNVGGITEMISISDERVVCVQREASQVIILDTTSEYKVSPIKLAGEFMTCNTKGQLITFDYSSRSLRLWHGQNVIWERHPPGFRLAKIYGFAMFSPLDQFVLITVGFHCEDQCVYVFDAVSGNPLKMLCESKSICGCTFVSDEECVVLTDDILSGTRLQMFNVRTRDLLNVMDIEHELETEHCLANCPEKGLIAIELERTKLGFKVIQVHVQKKEQVSLYL